MQQMMDIGEIVFDGSNVIVLETSKWNEVEIKDIHPEHPSRSHEVKHKKIAHNGLSMDSHKGRPCPVELMNGYLVIPNLKNHSHAIMHIATGTCPPEQEEATLENPLLSQLRLVIVDPDDDSMAPMMQYLRFD